jgi:hypothetical protein
MSRTLAIQFIPKNFVLVFNLYTLSKSHPNHEVTVVEIMVGQCRQNLLPKSQWKIIMTNLKDPGKARPASKIFICSGGA